VPYPIQSGSISDRLRKFFRIRGKTSFQLDEMVSPMVLVQDLTQGPYQAGVTPCAGVLTWTVDAVNQSTLSVILNDKKGSPTPVLGDQFVGRSFSVTQLEMQNLGVDILTDLQLRVESRGETTLAVPDLAASLVSIQNNPGTISVPVEMFGVDAGIGATGQLIWRGTLGGIGTAPARNEESLRVITPTPNITIGPGDAIVLRNATPLPAQGPVFVSIRGFYQEQPS